MASDDKEICGEECADGTTCEFPVDDGRDTCPNHGPGPTTAGAPAHEPDEVTEAVVEALAMQGASQKEIAERIGIHRETLANHYREILDRAKEAAEAQVVKTAFQMATSGSDPSMTKFWLKCQSDNWTPKEGKELSTEDGEDSPIMVIESSDD